jgi:type I restriction enzyme M protein
MLKNLEGGEGLDRRDVVSRVFQGTANRMLNGYLIRDVLNKLNEIHFTSSEELHTLSALYEGMLREMRDAAGDSGEFYTPRPVVKLMATLADPKLGEKVLDPACGTAGFLVESYEHIKKLVNTPGEREKLQRETLFGGEAKSLPYLLGEMNMLLHGVEVPNIAYGNSLAVKLTELGDRDRVDIILTNPPFGGEEEASIKTNFPADKQTSETALLFLQLIMRLLRRPGRPAGCEGGRAAVVVPNGTLFGDGVCARIKEQLLKEFNLHTVVRLPNGVFAPYTPIPTNILFFDRTGPTEEIWYYEHPLPEGRKNYTKTKPLLFEELRDFIKWWGSGDRAETDQIWKVPVEEVLKYDETGSVVSVNLDMRNPNTPEAMEHRPPEELVADIRDMEQRIIELMEEIASELVESPA